MMQRCAAIFSIILIAVSGHGQRPGSVDEKFAPRIAGPVRDLATRLDDGVIVVADNVGWGEVALFDRDGKNAILPADQPDVLAARAGRANTIEVIGRTGFWDTTDIFVKQEIDYSGRILAMSNPGLVGWQGRPFSAAVLNTNMLACGVAWPDADILYLEPNRMTWVVDGDHSIAVAGPPTSLRVRTFISQLDGQ